MGFKDLAFGKERRELEPLIRVKRLETRQRPIAKGTQRKQSGSAPAGVKASTTVTAIPEGLKFSFDLVNQDTVKGYNIYRNFINDPNTAELISFLDQPPETLNRTREFQDIVGAGETRFYWVEAVNEGATGSGKVSMQGATSTAGGGSSAISSLNGETGATQIFATGTAGTDFAISSAADVHTFNLPDASAANRGAVTIGTQTLGGDKTIQDDLRINGDIGFYNTAPVTKPTVSGSRGGNVALADLLTELATMGLITDSSS